MLSNIRVPTTAQIRALEAAWIKSAATTTGTNWSQVLMEIAGRGAAFATLSLWQEHPGHVTVICGRGNNGGDGLVGGSLSDTVGHSGKLLRAGHQWWVLQEQKRKQCRRANQKPISDCWKKPEPKFFM